MNHIETTWQNLIEEFPDSYVSVELTKAGKAKSGETTHRVAIVQNGQCDSGYGTDFNQAVAKLKENLAKPKTEAIKNARKLLEEAGYTITNPTPFQ
jgi:hypothetical protein